MKTAFLFLATQLIAANGFTIIREPLTRLLSSNCKKHSTTSKVSLRESSYDADHDESPLSHGMSRRDVMSTSFGSWLSTMLIPTVILSDSAIADDGSSVYRPAKRPTAYFVDSTIPPTLIPLATARQQTQILTNLGKGSGTQKESVVDDRINLNNMLNKAVFGTANQISSMLSPSTSGPTFVCLGLPQKSSDISAKDFTTAQEDMELAVQLSDIILRSRRGGGSRGNTAIGLAVCPWSVQPVLDQYIDQNGKEDELVNALQQGGVPEATIDLYLPLFRWAQREHWKLLALAPEPEDVTAARRDGLQNVNPERRVAYVPDAQGFISLSQDPQYRLYADRSLLKDFPEGSKESPAKFFAERILVHETAATAVAKFATSRDATVTTSSSMPLVIVVAPTSDVRFLSGINGRIPRLVRFFDANAVIPTTAVTTILLNPTAASTLSKTRYLRLEIGTGPETLDYQTKIADYLWFSKIPKVNMISRLMDF